MNMVDIVRWVHIVAGVFSLGAFWIPLATRKGSPIHRRAGWVYACAMWTAALGAWGICAARLRDDNEANDAAAWFLAFVGLLSANGAVTGIRVLRRKSRTSEGTSAFDVGSSAVFLVAAIALGGFGIARDLVLHIVFALLGIALSLRQLLYWRRGAVTKMEWWYAHMGNMLAACIGTVTAFLVVNVSRFGLEPYALYFWFGPGVIGGIAIAVWTGYYRRKFDGRSARPRHLPQPVLARLRAAVVRVKQR